jgi:hypothetical protein
VADPRPAHRTDPGALRREVQGSRGLLTASPPR